MAMVMHKCPHCESPLIIEKVKIKSFECPFGCLNGACRANIKDKSKYSEPDSKHAFLISDDNWRLIQQLKTIVNWTENGVNYEYSLLIYDGNSNKLIENMNMLEITKITAIDDFMISNLLNDQSFLNSLATVDSVEVISQYDYFSFWLIFSSMVYVEDNISLVSEATEFASSINAPLIIQDSSLDNPNVFQNRYVICIGDISSNKCDEYKNG